ncbi:hypothetical protein ScPMuIL_002369 [Solemya velum]
MSDDTVITEQVKSAGDPFTTVNGNSENVVTGQPGGQGSSLPLGLQQLASQNEITIHQHLDQLEVLLGWQRPCRYSIYGADSSSQLLYIQEVSECFARQCLGSSRWFNLRVSDSNQQDVAIFDRPFRCPCGLCWWWCCCVQELAVETPPGKWVSTIREERTAIGSPRYHISTTHDDDDDLVFVIPTSCCYCKFCADVEILIYDKRKEEKVCVIHKHSRGSRQECCGSQNEFTIKFLAELNVTEKLMILGASFLLDFNFFEGQRRCCCCCCL